MTYRQMRQMRQMSRMSRIELGEIDNIIGTVSTLVRGLQMTATLLSESEVPPHALAE